MKPNALRSLGLFCAVVVSASLPVGRASASTLINFDTFPGGAVVPSGTLITTQYAALGVLFASPTSVAGAPTASANGEASSGPNHLSGLAPGGQGGLHPITMDFTPDLADTVNLTLISVGSGTTTATAYDSTLTTICGTVSLTHGAASGNGFGNHDPITLTQGTCVGIARITFSIAQNPPGLDGYGIDDVTFTLVPEPASSAALAVFGLLCLRRRR